MKRFLIKLILFISPLLVLYLYLEVRLRTINSYYKQKIEGLEAKATKIQILILGNSHSEHAFNPAFFSLPTYNMAFGYQPLYYDEKIIERELNLLTALRYVFIDFSYHSLYMSDAGERNYFYKYYYGIKPNIKESFWKKDLSHFFFLYTPKTSFKILSSKNEILTNGYRNYDTTILDQFNEGSAKERMQQLTSGALTNNSNIEFNIRNVKKLILLLKKRNITPIIITPPISQLCNDFANQKIIRYNRLVIEGICKKYDVVYLDYQKSSLFSNNDFYDLDHLNNNGSIKFSKVIDSIVIKKG